MSDHESSRAEVGFIGSGVMGRSMALNLLQAGYRVTLHTRTKDKADDVLAAGGRWAPTVADASREKDFIVTIVGFPEDVREVYLAEGGVVDVARAGAIVIDMTTSEPSLAVEISDAAAKKGVSALDAPVSGGDVGARNATLSIMVGGEKQAFESARPLLAAMGSTVVLQGPAGSGQHTKLCNQVVIASTMIGVMEGLLYARRAGLDPEVVLDSIGAGAAGSWTLQNLYPRVVRGDYEPGFFVRHFQKDIRIAMEEAENMGLDLNGLALADALYQQVADMGGALQGTQAIYRAIDESES